MKKFILTMIIAFMMVFSANAQIATENAKLFDNTYAGIEVGATTPLNFNSMFPLNTTVGVKFGKEFTPVFALEVEGLASLGDNVNRYGVQASVRDFNAGAFNVHKTGSVNTFVKSTNVGLNGVINLSNLFFGYNGAPRVFELKTNTGLGWGHYFGDFKTEMTGAYAPVGYRNVFTAKTGLDLAFNLGAKKAHTITVSPGIYWNLSETGPIKFDKTYAQFGIMAGYTYHFKTTNGTHHFRTYDVGAMMDEISHLNEELAKKPTEVEVIKYVDRVVNNYSTVIAETTVFFAFDSDELDARAKDELDKIAQNGIYVVDAYASSEGTTEYNKELSQRRADAVKAYLEGRGCRVDAAVGHGVQFGTTTGRVAVVTFKK